IEIAVREHDARDGALSAPARVAGLERRARLDLPRDVRRAVEEEPIEAIGAHRHRVLAAADDLAASCGRTIGAAAVPLGNTAAGGASEDADEHCVTARGCAGAIVAAGARTR